MKINASKSTFCTDKIENLGYWITRNGIKPLEKKVQAILNLSPPTTTKQTISLLGIVQYYRDIWEKHSHILAPLTELTREPKIRKRGQNSSGEKNNKKHLIIQKNS